MADIELVIKIPEEDYKRGTVMASAIRNGIPLPKGHGRLIDADELIGLMDIVEEENKEDKELHLLNIFAKKLLNDAPTIIEADKE